MREIEWPAWLEVSDEVGDALRSARPLVALESTVLAHGLPRPRNLEVALALETLVRQAGAVPATIAVIEGRARVGLATAQLERIALDDGVHKLSTRDLPLALARRSTGATTVASTAFLATRAGISVFATGGIGGIHRGAPPDVSADLVELGRTPIVVVCAGAKSILDLPATREALETLGVLVLGWRTDELPAFYSRSSGLPVDGRVEDASGVARIWEAQRAIGIAAACLVCAPIPDEHALDQQQADSAIVEAVAEARSRGISGKAITPHLLRRLAEVTGGKSLEANVALLENNTRIAAAIAAAMAAS